jgi:hypothetical protein
VPAPPCDPRGVCQFLHGCLVYIKGWADWWGGKFICFKCSFYPLRRRLSRWQKGFGQIPIGGNDCRQLIRGAYAGEIQVLQPSLCLVDKHHPEFLVPHAVVLVLIAKAGLKCLRELSQASIVTSQGRRPLMFQDSRGRPVVPLPNPNMFGLFQGSNSSVVQCS